MVFYLKVLGSRVKGVLLSPVKTWKTIKKESGYPAETIVFIFICCLLAGIFSFIRGTSAWIPEIFVPFFTILLSSVIIRFFKEVQRINWEGSFNLIVYSYFPLILCYGLSFINYREFILPLGLIYSTILLYISIKSVFNISVGKSLSLLVKITFIVFFCFWVLMVLFSK